MIREEVSAIKEVAKSYRSEALEDSINREYPYAKDSEYIGPFLISNVISEINDAVSRTLVAIDRGYMYILPPIIEGDSYGENFSIIVNASKNGIIREIPHALGIVVKYQLTYGLFSILDTNQFENQRENFKDFSFKLQDTRKKLERTLSESEKLIYDFKSEITSTINSRDSKIRELDEVDKFVKTARNQIEEIDSITRKGRDTVNDLEVLLAKSDQRSETALESVDNARKHYEELIYNIVNFRDDFDTVAKDAQKYSHEFDKIYTSITERSLTFDEKINQLNELLGKEAAKQLFNTFNARKKELEQPVKDWAIRVYGVSLISFILIIALFTNGFGYYGDAVPKTTDWQYFLMTITKTIPIMLIFYFTIRQYNRERTFMEEYAFRSATALTIQAYADLAGERKSELIMSAVTSIYAPPRSMRENSSLFAFNSKHMPELMKEMNESLKTLVSKRDSV